MIPNFETIPAQHQAVSCAVSYVCILHLLNDNSELLFYLQVQREMKYKD